VSATGTLGAESTVQVGTQVSGQVEEVRADFNDRVSKGRIIARIDATLLEQQVREAEASLERARADLDQKEYALEQAKALFDQKIVTEGDYRTAIYNHTVSNANLVSAEAGLDRAKRNLEYSVIYAPIDGIVVERNVEPGQTVAASLSAPQLFLIAEDLTNMQILVSVDESDIGKIEEGQTARFTVQAYPERTFEGAVRQVRLQSSSSENVVNYTVVVGVSNPEGTLLPGMTATVAFVLASAEDVLLVPNAALRFRASEAMQAEVAERMAAAAGQRAASGDTSAAGGAAAGGRGGRADGTAQSGGRPSGAGAAGATAQLWYVDEQGQLSVARVRSGLTDGQNTEIRGGPALTEGLQVIASVTGSGTSASTTTASNPFQQQQQSGASGRGRGGF
jgi:HlyD family secretion protein